MHVRLLITALCCLTACYTGKIDTSPYLDTGSGTDSDSGTTPPTTLAWTTYAGATTPKRDQIYDIEFPSVEAGYLGDGCILVSDPYYDHYTGAVYYACPGAVELSEDAERLWTGTGTYQGLGCQVGTTAGLVTVPEFNDPTYEGRLFGFSLDAESGPASDNAVLDITGTEFGDANTGGYFGVAVAVLNGRIYVSQTNASSSVLSAPWPNDPSDLTIDDFTVTVASSDPVADGGAGFVAYEVSAGEDGTAWASYDGALQHVSIDGTPDWWVDESGSGTGEYDFPLARNVTRWTAAGRLVNGDIVLSVFSRLSGTGRYRDAVVYARVFSQDGAEADYYPTAFDVVDGWVGGTHWTAFGIAGADPNYDPDNRCESLSATTTADFTYDSMGRIIEPSPSFPGQHRGTPRFSPSQRSVAPDGTSSGYECRYGYIYVQTDDGQEWALSLPFESGTFPEAGCLLTLASDGGEWLGWACRDQPYMGWMQATLADSADSADSTVE